MNIEKITSELEKMKGRQFIFKREHHRLLSYRVIGEDVTIVTDKDWFTKHFSEVNLFLGGFMEVEEESETTVALAVTQPGSMSKGVNAIQELSSIVLENIQNIKLGKEYIPQANAINNQLRTMIQLASLQIKIQKK